MKKFLPYILTILVLAAAGAVAYKSYPSYMANRTNITDKTNKKDEVGQAGTSSTEPLSFTHPELGFTINYPAYYNITDLAEDRGETILLQNDGRGAQIYISDYKSQEQFNSALVRRELSGQTLENLKDIAMPGGFSAVSFSGKDESLGKVWDVWFVNNGKLYQITSEPNQDALLKSLVESFKFSPR